MRKHAIFLTGFLALIIALTLAGGEAHGAQDWGKVEGQIEQEAGRAIKDAGVTEDLIQKDRSVLMDEARNLKAQIATVQKEVDGLKAFFEQLSKREVALKKELAEEHREVEAVEGTVRSTAKEASPMVRDNPITAENPKRIKVVDGLMESKHFPGIEGVSSLMDLYFDEFAAGGKISRYQGDFVGTDGKMASGEVVRVGRFTAFFRLPDGTVGFLKPESSGERLIAISGDIPRSHKKAIEAYFAGSSKTLPLDLSGGGVFSQLLKEWQFGEFMEQGGVVMWPILALAILAVLLIIERLVVLSMTKASTDNIMDKINEAASRSQWDECSRVCEENKRIPTCRMLAQAINHVGATQEVLENSLQEAVLREMPRLERFLPTLAVLAVIAPLLGLLGTVSGMINIFKVITVVGTGDPRVMSGGISEALLTTEFGLVVAIPLMVIHHFLERRVDKIAGDMEEKGTAFVVTLTKHGAIIGGKAESAAA